MNIYLNSADKSTKQKESKLQVFCAIFQKFIY